MSVGPTNLDTMPPNNKGRQPSGERNFQLIQYRRNQRKTSINLSTLACLPFDHHCDGNVQFSGKKPGVFSLALRGRLIGKLLQVCRLFRR